MTVGTSKPRRILALVDRTGPQVALESALALAEAHGAELQVAACLEPPHDLAVLARLSGSNPDQLVAEAVEQARGDIEASLSAIMPGRAVVPHVLVGKAYLEIIRHVASSGCDFVVKTAEPLSGVGRFLFASTDQHLLRKCPCPVWLQTPKARARPRRILAAVDLDLADAAEPETLSALNRRVMDAACMIACDPDAEVIVLHAWEAPGEGMIWAFAGGRDSRLSADRYVNEVLGARQNAMSAFLDQVREELAPQAALVSRLVRGSPVAVVQDQGRQLAADVVVMGTLARTGLSGVLIGNTAENIINSLECPVLAVKPDGFVSPLLGG